MNQSTQLLVSNEKSQQPYTEQDDSLDIRKYLGLLYDNRWVIASIAFVVTLFGVAYAFLAKPIYEANILLQVEDGRGAAGNMLDNVPSTFDLRIAAGSEIEILRSRMVISRAVDNARLYINVQPKYFPVIGSWIARRNGELSEPGIFGYGGYVWGSERADVSIFNVPEGLEGAPFLLTAEGNDAFRLSQEDDGIEIRGRVGNIVKVQSEQGEIELRIDHLAAKPGAQFSLTRTAQLDAIESLQDALKVSEKGRQTGIINVSLEGSDPKKISRILKEIGQEYVRQNEDRKAEQAEKSLAFLNKQLPELKEELERSEAKYNAMRNQRGTVDLGEEAKAVLGQSTATQTKLLELKQKKEELLYRFQEDHPSVEAINQQIRTVNRELANVDAKIKRLPTVEQDVLRLTRDVRVNTEVYTAGLSTAQQLRLVTASKVGNARLLDTPMPPTAPIKPRRMLVILIVGMIGLVLGVIGAYIRKVFYGRIDDPQEIKQLFGVPLSATIPHSQGQEQLYAQIQSKSRAVSVLASSAPGDSAVESLRGFRASLQFSMRDSSNNIIVITSPTPEVGKSFVAANFATVLAAVGKKILLIDGDLRKGHLHRYFGLDRKKGLAEAILAPGIFEQIIQRNVVENVDFISTGNLPRKPAELLGHQNFGTLLRLLSGRYDYVLVDTAPVLAVADALTVGPYAGAMFNVVRGGVTTANEIEETVKRLNQAGATVTGTVFNDLRPRHARYGYGSLYEGYGYAGQA